VALTCHKLTGLGQWWPNKTTKNDLLTLIETKQVRNHHNTHVFFILLQNLDSFLLWNPDSISRTHPSLNKNQPHSQNKHTWFNKLKLKMHSHNNITVIQNGCVSLTKAQT